MKSKIVLQVSLVIIAFVSAFNSEVQAESPVPQFKDYPVTERFTGKNAPVKLTRENRVFRTRLRKAAKEKPNFAGRYIHTAWGCGMECLMDGVIDAKTGKVYGVPFSICCWGTDYDDDFEPIEYRIDSRLIIYTGARNEKKGDAGKHYYMFDGRRFVHLMSQIGVLPKRTHPIDTDLE